MADQRPLLKIKLQLYCGEEIAMGPGKADLLEAIEREGSISAAARALSMSYRRAWLLVDTMNRCWGDRLVQTGGGGRGGASVTEPGRRVLSAYRALQRRAAGLRVGEEWEMLHKMLRDHPSQRQGT